MRRRIAALAGALLAVLALTACGAKKDAVAPTAKHPQALSLMLDWTPNADHVGIYEGIADGAFTAAGLDVTVRIPPNPAAPLSLLEAGKVDVAITYEPQLMLARAKGATLVAFGALVQRPLTSIISLGKEHITSVKQLQGKTVGDAGIPYQQDFLKTVLQHAGVPASSVKEVNVGDDLVGSLLSGRVDATLGAYWNYEALQLAQDGRRPNVIHIENAGVPNYDELVLVTTETTFANHTTELRRFAQALGRSYTAVRANPQAAVNTLVRANPSLNPKLQLASVKATLPSFFPAQSGLPWGWMMGSQWNAFGKWMLAEHLFTNPAAVPDASTNQLLAGQGP
jgi:putative hydroxymethylpyrimidine transport system substrate-binding protein